LGAAAPVARPCPQHVCRPPGFKVPRPWPAQAATLVQPAV